MISTLLASSTHTIAAPLPLGNYSFFKLKKPLVIERRGKPVSFPRGENLGWRYSSSGTHFRLISLKTGVNVVYSIKITDESLKWLMAQDPKVKKPGNAKPGGTPVDKVPPASKGKVTEEQFRKRFLPSIKKHASQVLRNIVREAKDSGADKLTWKVVGKVLDSSALDGQVLPGSNSPSMVYVAFSVAFPHQVDGPNQVLRDRLSKVLNAKTPSKSPLSIDGVPVRTQVSNQFLKSKDSYEFVYYVPVAA